LKNYLLKDISVPLTYDDGTNLRQKNCDDSEKSYYICRAKGKLVY